MNTPLAPEQLEALRRLDACTLANAIETFHVRLRDEGFTDATIRCLFPRLQPMLGYAATVKIRGSRRRRQTARSPTGPIGGTTSRRSPRRG